MTLNASNLSLNARTARRFVLLQAVVLAGALHAQVVKAPRYQGGVEAPAPVLNLPPVPPAITPHGTVVEDIVVRVNDQIISRSDVMRQQEQLNQAAAQGNVPPAELASQQKNMLRDMIDQQLLLSRAKELGLNADSDVIRRLDDIRKQNHFESMDELERAARKEGVNFEDFKAQIRNQLLTQMVVRDEVGRHLQMTQAEAQKFYDDHKQDFTQPEQVKLSEILIPTPDNPTPEQIAQAEAKANDVKAQVAKGADFGDLAKKYSGGPSAAQGGDLGLFKRGALAKVLEDQTFALKAGESTAPIRTRQGFVILKVTQHDLEGPAPFNAVVPQIEEALYMQQMQPALRTYLTKLREDFYVDIQPGFVDSGASASQTKPVFTAYAPPPVKKKVDKQKARFDRNGPATKSVISSPDTTGGRTLTGPDAPKAATSAAPKIDPATGMASISMPAKPNGNPGKHLKREKIRFGQAPRTSIASDPDEAGTAAAPAAGAVAPGAVMASNGTQGSNLDDNPLTPQAPVKQKTRFAAKEAEVKEKKVLDAHALVSEKNAAKPQAASAEEKAAAKEQAAPLGLAGDTSKKPPKPKRVKGQPKERLEDKPSNAKPAAPAPVDQTVSPALAPTAVSPAPAPAPQN